VDGPTGPRGTVGVVKVPNPDDPTEKAYIAAQKKRVDMDRELRLIRAKYFRGINNTEIRQVGLSKLRAFTDPAVYPALLELFKDDQKDVREAILDHLIDRENDEADAAVAWAAVFDDDKWFRREAGQRLLERTERVGVSNRIKSVVATGLRTNRTNEVVAAAELAGVLTLYEAIPMLINAQVQGDPPQRAADGGDAALAYILVGQQVAFVSDLTPVVGDSAVAFDPTLSVATDGVVLRVINAVVVTYRVEVHNALIGLANAGWDGRDTSPMGWDEKKWRDWHAADFVPYRRQVEAAAAKADAPS
jgi:hypothetical protein